MWTWRSPKKASRSGFGAGGANSRIAVGVSKTGFACKEARSLWATGPSSRMESSSPPPPQANNVNNNVNNNINNNVDIEIDRIREPKPLRAE